MMNRLRTLSASRYVLPLKEGGSLPAIVDTDDGLFVVKFRGAGQGARVLIAEIVVAGLAEALGLRVPELALVDLDESFGRSERDPEIRHILQGSVGLNVGLRYLEGAFNFDPEADAVDGQTASLLVWLDAFTGNVDRTAKNPNLMWHDGQLWLIDHGASLYFHHDWDSMTSMRMRDAFVLSREHVLLGRADNLREADSSARGLLGPGRFKEILQRVPDSLLMDARSGSPPPFGSAAENRDAYLDYFSDRIQHTMDFVQAAIDAREKQAASVPRREGYRR